MAIKTIDKKFLLSDSSVNEYGFRLLTSGYQLDNFAKNPIGFRMHNRDAGVLLKWNNLKIEGDNITASPEVNLSNSAGQQLADEIENGFMNAASMGHFVVLESKKEIIDGKDVLTVTKWYNKEASIVDIPGNQNALCQLYDINDNLLNLPDLLSNQILNTNTMEITLTPEVLSSLGLRADATGTAVVSALGGVLAEKRLAETNLQSLTSENANLKVQIAEINDTNLKAEIKGFLDAALASKKITVKQSEIYTNLFASKPKELKELLDATPVYISLNNLIDNSNNPNAKPVDGEGSWSFYDYEKKNPARLQYLKANDTEKYNELYKKEFGTLPTYI